AVRGLRAARPDADDGGDVEAEPVNRGQQDRVVVVGIFDPDPLLRCPGQRRHHPAKSNVGRSSARATRHGEHREEEDRQCSPPRRHSYRCYIVPHMGLRLLSLVALLAAVVVPLAHGATRLAAAPQTTEPDEYLDINVTLNDRKITLSERSAERGDGITF